MIKIFKPVDAWASFINLVVLALSVVLITSHRNLPPQIPLWLSRPWGEERLSNPENLWILAGLILAFFLIANISAKLIFAHNETLAKILVWSAAFISLVFLLSLYKLILASI